MCGTAQGSGYCCARRHTHVQHGWLTLSPPPPCTLAPHLPVVCGKARVNVNEPLREGGVDEGGGRGDARRLVAVFASLGVGVGGGVKLELRLMARACEPKTRTRTKPHSWPKEGMYMP